MKRHHRNRPGAPPGVLIPRPDAEPSRVVVRKYGADTFEELSMDGLDQLDALRDPSCVLWVDVTGLAGTDVIAALGRTFGIHALSLEDVLDPSQRAKVEHYDDYTFVVLDTLSTSHRVEAHVASLFFGDGFVVTLQDVDDGTFEPVRERVRKGRGRVRHRGADYLAYALVDSVIDGYFPVIETFDDHLERVEDAVLDAHDDPLDMSRSVRRDLQTIRHAVFPARDVVVALLHDGAPRITDETRVHLRDCYDHVIQLQEMVEISREIAASLLESYLSAVSLRTNDQMKLLTIIATVFIPLTFITSVYGMNFSPDASPFNMPELRWYWGYPLSLLVMAVVAAGSLIYFRRKGWLGRSETTSERAD